MRDQFLTLDLRNTRLSKQDCIEGVAGEGVFVARVRAGRQDVVRTPQMARRDGLDHVFANLQVAGSCEAEQDGRKVRLTPGRLALFDGARPYALHFAGPFEQFVLRLPRAYLARLGGDLSRISAQGVDDGTAIGALAVQAVRAMQGGLRDLADQHGMLSETVLRFALADLAARGAAAPGSLREITRARALAIIRAEACDPDLTPVSLALRLGCSLRHLQMAFAEEAETVAARIWGVRLDTAAHLLISRPRWQIDYVALACGFQTASHFSARFRRQYGSSPRQWRDRQFGQI